MRRLRTALALLVVGTQVPWAGYTWNTLKMGGTGFVSGVVASRQVKNLHYIRTDVGGAYRWNQVTSHWTPLLDWAPAARPGIQGVSSIALDPQNPARLYLMTGINYFDSCRTILLRSNDSGYTFDTIDVSRQFNINGNGTGRHLGERLAVDPNNSEILIAGSGMVSGDVRVPSSGAHRSLDRGRTWTKLSGGLPGNVGISFIAFDSASTASKNVATPIIYVGVSRSGASNVYRSKDAGANWSVVAGLPTNLVPQHGIVTENGTLHVTYADAVELMSIAKGAIWKVTRAGVATNITPAGLAIGYSGINAYPKDPNRLIVSSVNYYVNSQCWASSTCDWATAAWGDVVMVSTNGGTSWSNMVTGVGGTAKLRSVAGSATWAENANSNLHWAGGVTFDPFNPDRAIVTSGHGVFRAVGLTTAKQDWYFSVKGLEEGVVLKIVPLSGGVKLTAMYDYDGFRHVGTDAYPRMNHVRPGQGGGSLLAVAQKKPAEVAYFAGKAESKLIVSSDTGKTWTLRTPPSTARGGALVYTADGSALLWIVGKTKYRSTDRGATWVTSTWPGATSPDVVADPVNPKLLYSVDHGNGNVFVSLDGGVTFAAKGTLTNWITQSGVIPIPGRVGEFWVSTNTGVWNDGWKRRLLRGRIDGTTGAFALVDSIRNDPNNKTTGVQRVDVLGLGKAAPGQSHPAMYAWGVIGGVNGLFRSDDTGSTWLRINDDAHQYGGPGNGQFLTGDPDVYGRVYMGTFGRGVVYGEPSGAVANQNPVVGVQASATLVSAPGSVTLTATASDADGAIAKVDLLQNGVVVSSKTAAPYSFPVSGLVAGTYSFAVRATDNVGGVTNSPTISVTVSAAPVVNVAPTIALQSSAATAVAPATVTLTATPADADGSIAKVEWLQNGSVVATTTAAPWTYAPTGLASGSYSFTARATDNAGAATLSAAVALNVTTPVNQAPAVSLQASVTSGATPLATTLTATASDADGSVARVDFYQGTALLGSDVVAPFSWALTNLATGNYSFQAVATDNLGAKTTSSTVTVQVQTAPSGLALAATPNPMPSAGNLSYYLTAKPASNPVFNVYTAGGLLVRSFVEQNSKVGANLTYIQNSNQLTPGSYRVSMVVGGVEMGNCTFVKQ